MWVLKLSSKIDNNWWNNAPRWLVNVVREVTKMADSIVNGKDIQMFERMLQEIIWENHISHYDSNESYYEKLELLWSFRDIDDIVLISNGGMTYTVKWHEGILFTRWELEKIWEKYTQFKIPELY